jgi:hypothetical protein
MPDLPEIMNQHLTMTATVIVGELDAEARAELADLALWPLAQIVEVLDERTCPLCEYVDGMILDRRSPEFERWRNPSHINCRRTLAYVSSREREIGPDGQPIPTRPDFVEPPAALIYKHGHFVVDPERYSPLRIPAQPEGRDFVFKRIRDPESGDLVSVLHWRTRMYEIPGLKPGTIQIPAP